MEFLTGKTIYEWGIFQQATNHRWFWSVFSSGKMPYTRVYHPTAISIWIVMMNQWIKLGCNYDIPRQTHSL